MNKETIKQHAPDLESRIKRRANALFIKISGGKLREYSLLRHIGRISGREYLTPLSAYPLGDGFVMALLYGDAMQVDWTQNIFACGRCFLKTYGQEYELARPEIINDNLALPAFPSLLRFYYRSRSIHQFLWVHKQTI